MKIVKRFTFDAAHRLPDWPSIHGHSYEAEVWFEGPVVDGYVIRESLLSELTDAVRKKLDHRFLNDIIPVPTSENLALMIWNELSSTGMLRKVRIFRSSCAMGVEYEGESSLA